MKKTLFVSSMIAASIAHAISIPLACEGITTTKSEVFVKNISEKEKIKINKEPMLVNLLVNTDNKTITTYMSDITVVGTYPGLDISDQFYWIPIFKRSVRGYKMDNISIMINRFTGSVEIETFSISEGVYGNSVEGKFRGSCQIGASWQPKF